MDQTFSSLGGKRQIQNKSAVSTLRCSTSHWIVEDRTSRKWNRGSHGGINAKRQKIHGVRKFALSRAWCRPGMGDISPVFVSPMSPVNLLPMSPVRTIGEILKRNGMVEARR